jgi:hypothetical protein
LKILLLSPHNVQLESMDVNQEQTCSYISKC